MGLNENVAIGRSGRPGEIEWRRSIFQRKSDLIESP